jgi:GNAT superfamily N-acetyltransferase
MGLTPVPAGHVAAVVTSLEMVDRPAPRPAGTAPLRLARWASPSLAAYRTLFRRVGEPWLWFSRLVMPEAELGAILGNPDVEIYAVTDPHGLEVGMVELDFRKAGECELAFFGLVPELAGKGLGRWLMAQATMLAWRKRERTAQIARFWVHTCSLDHPAALGFYVKSGFRPYKREIEVFADPRPLGLLPREAAPQIPLL